MMSREYVCERITQACVEGGLDLAIANEIGFHMTDWKENLEQMYDLYDHASELSGDDIRSIIIVFLAHVPNHVAAAKKLIGLGPIEDIFDVGVLVEDVDEDIA